MVGQNIRQSRFSWEFITGLNQKLNFNSVAYEAFCLKGLISSFSGVLTMRLFLTVQLRQWRLSGPRVQPVLCNRVFKNATRIRLELIGVIIANQPRPYQRHQKSTRTKQKKRKKWKPILLSCSSLTAQ